MSRNQRGRILVVDDETETCAMIERYFARSSENVVTVNSAAAALSILADTVFDVMVTDIRLPDIDGIELIKRAHALQEDIETIVITAYGDLDIAVEALRVGVKNFFTKPLRLRLLKMSIREVLNRKRDYQRLKESEVRFRRMFEMHSAPMLLIHPETGDIVSANHSAAAFYGYGVDELSRMNMCHIYLLTPEQIGSENRRALSGNRECRIFRNRLKSGEIRIVEVHASPVEIENKFYLFSVIHDVSERRQAQAALCRRLVVEEMVSTLSASFIKISNENLDGALKNALRTIGKFVDADRSFLCRFAESSETVEPVHEWCAEDVRHESVPPIAELIPSSSWTYDRLRKYETLCMPRLDDLPEASAGERSRWEAAGIHSFFAVPFMLNGAAGGFFGFTSAREKTEWTREDIGLLKIVGEIISNLLARKSAEEALAESRKRFHDLYNLMRLITDNVPDMIWAKDMDDRYLFANQSICDHLIMCGTPEDAIGKTDLFFSEREQNLGHRHTFGEICVNSDDLTKRSKAPGRFLEEGFVRGKYLILDVHKAPLYNHEGIMIGTVGSGRNVTREKRMESELAKNREKLRMALEATTDSVWEWDIVNNIVHGDLNTAEALGIDPSDSTGVFTEWKNRLHDDDRKMVIRSLENHLSGKADQYKVEYRIRNNAGEWRWILSRGKVAERDEAGHPLRMIGTNVDITHRKRMEEAVIKARIEAEDASRAKSEFLANMSHEIRTPISGILGAADMLLSRETDSGKREYLELMKGSAASLLNIISETLDLSTIEARKFRLVEDEFDLFELLEKVGRFFTLGTRNRGLAFHMNIGSKVPQRIRGDKDRLEQVLVNLVGNAVKFTLAGEVRVEIDRIGESPGAKLCFYISDTGIGIDPEDIPRLFQPFSQLDSSPSKQFPGTGLGLAISQKIVEMMGGEIRVESSPGKGSTFYFVIGCQELDSPKGIPVDKGTFPISDDTHPLDILIAEDDPLNRISLVHFLKHDGHRVTAVADGKSVLKTLAGQAFDIILMDIQMPVMDGIETAREIRRNRSGAFDPTLPIIALTAYSMPGDRERVMEAGMDGYVTKPVNMDELRRVIRHETFRRKETAASDALEKAFSSAAREPLDEIREYVDRYLQEDPSFLKEMLNGFLAEAPQRIAIAEAGIAGPDISGAAKAAHSLVSMLGAVRITSLATVAREVEQNLLKGDLKKAEELFRFLKEKAEAVFGFLESGTDL